MKNISVWYCTDVEIMIIAQGRHSLDDFGTRCKGKDQELDEGGMVHSPSCTETQAGGMVFVWGQPMWTGVDGGSDCLVLVINTMDWKSRFEVWVCECWKLVSSVEKGILTRSDWLGTGGGCRWGRPAGNMHLLSGIHKAVVP